jgi:hypothetical protein
MPENDSVNTTPTPVRPPRAGAWRMLKAILYGGLAGAALAVGTEAWSVMLGKNFHAVIPGRVYRCAQLSGPTLGRLLDDYHIRTVINLRGCCAPFPWYLDECRATHDRNVSQEDVCFSAGRLPSVTEMRHFVEVLDRSEYPILFHCRRGADRTGMAAAIVLLLQTDLSLESACGQLSLRYGHLALGRPAYLDYFLDLYRAWLERHGREHSRAAFRRWIQDGYCPGVCRCRIEPMAILHRVERGKPAALQVRFHNTGIHTWHLQPESNAGVHGRYVLWDDHDVQVASARAGLFHARVPPGRSIDLTLALPALRTGGNYRLIVDLVDEQQAWFFQTGSEPLEMEFVVR